MEPLPTGSSTTTTTLYLALPSPNNQQTSPSNPEPPRHLHPIGVVSWAAACTAFYGLMRLGELTTKDNTSFDKTWQAQRAHFSLHPNPSGKPFWSLYLPRTKNGTPGTVFLGKSGEFDCPFVAISNIFATVIALNHDPAFSLGPNQPLYRGTFLHTIRTALEAEGLANGILGHSFRIGGATILAEAGYPDHIIKLAGWWKSSTFLRYIHRHEHILPQMASILAAFELNRSPQSSSS